jgi:hypothetical protein
MCPFDLREELDRRQYTQPSNPQTERPSLWRRLLRKADNECPA